MEILAERTRQALHLGDLKPTSLEAHHKMLEQAGEYVSQLRKLQKTLRTWEHYNTEFLSSVGSFIKDTPFPMQWRQEELTLPAESFPAPIVAEHAVLFDKLTQDELADSVPENVKRVVDAELVHPIDLFLTAYDSAKERMGPLESLRLRYDAARRRISAEAASKAAEVAAGSSGHLTTHGKEEHVDPVKAAIDAQRKSDPALQEFELEELATYEHLVWLTNASVRMKAYMTHVLKYIRDAALGFRVPDNLLEAFPTHVLRVKEEEAAAGAEHKGKAPAGGETGAPEQAPDTAATRDQEGEEEATPAVGGSGSILGYEGDEVTGGSGEGAYRLVGQLSIEASEHLLVGGVAKEPGVVPSANKAPDQPPDAVIKRWDSHTVITTHGVGSVVVEPAPAPHTDEATQTGGPAQGSARDQGSAGSEPQACPGVPPGEFAPRTPVGDDGVPVKTDELNIDEEYENAALAVAEAKVACLEAWQGGQGQRGHPSALDRGLAYGTQEGEEQQGRQAQDSVAMEGTEGVGRGGRVGPGITTVPHAAVRGGETAELPQQEHQQEQPEWAEGKEPEESADEVAALLQPGRSQKAADVAAAGVTPSSSQGGAGGAGRGVEAGTESKEGVQEGTGVSGVLGAIRHEVEEGAAVV